MVHVHGHKNVHTYTKNDFVPFCQFVYFSENHVFMSMCFFFKFVKEEFVVISLSWL